MRKIRTPRLFCSFCGEEIAVGETYWYINGFVLCSLCLPDFARQEYIRHRCVRGEEDVHDAD